MVGSRLHLSMNKRLAVELFFDRAASDRVRAVWHSIGSTLPERGAEPHLTLSVHDASVEALLVPLVQAFAQAVPAFPISIASIGTFPTLEGVVFAAPVVTSGLLALHANFHEKLSRAGLFADTHYQPGHWVPHVTLAQELSSEVVAEIVQRSRDSDLFGPAHLVEIGVVEFAPSRQVCRFNLQGQ